MAIPVMLGIEPNITGGINDIHVGSQVKSWGSFVWKENGIQIQNTIKTGYAHYGDIGMWANNASNVYGTSLTVQPESVQILIIIKI